MQKFNLEKDVLMTGLAVVAPTVVGGAVDYLFSTVAFTFVGAAFTICELAERLLNRFAGFFIKTRCPDKLIGL